MAIEIVDLPIKNGDFHSYVNVYQVVFHSYVSLPEGNQQLRFCTATIWADRYWESFAKKYPANENMVQGIIGSVHAQKSAGIKDIWGWWDCKKNKDK